MRIAVVSDIHGNLTAFEAVLADLRQTAPDLVLHGGDLADSGSSPIEIIDRIIGLGWPGVPGNTDEMLIHPESLEEFARKSAAPDSLWSAVRDIAAATRTALGQKRLDFLRSLPRIQVRPPLALVHASPESCWHAPSSNATDAELEAVFGSLGQPIVAFGHTHHPFVRTLESSGLVVANTGSIGLPYDGDPRASYLLLDDTHASIRRVDYERDKELKLLSACGLPGAEWTAKMLVSASPQLP